MKKILALFLTLALVAALAVPALAVEVTTVPDPENEEGYTENTVTDEEAGIMPHTGDAVPGIPGAVYYGRPQEIDASDVPVPERFLGELKVDGEVVDTSAIPGAPVGYIPMRALCDAMGTYVDWYAEDNEAFFMVDGLGVIVDLGDLSVKCDFEDVPGVTAYLDPAGYTFLPLEFLLTFPNIKDVTNPALSSIHYDLVTRPERSALEQVADAVAEAAGVGATMQVDMDTAADFGLTPENYTEAVVLFPMMSANASSVYVAEVAEGKLDAAKADFQAVSDFLMQSFGNYPACAEMIRAGKIVTCEGGDHIALIVGTDVEAGVAVFQAAFPARER